MMNENRRRRLATALLGTALTVAGIAAADSGNDDAKILRCEDRRDPVATLLPYLENDQPELRARALLAIGRIAGPAGETDIPAPVYAALTRRLQSDPVAEVRRTAAFALGLLQTEAAAVRLAALFAVGGEPDGAVRAAAVEGLGRCGFAAHAAAMGTALADADPRVHRAALLAVWKGAAGRHLARIVERSADREPETRWRASYALMRSLGADASGRTPLPEAQPLTEAERAIVAERLRVLATDADVRVRLQVLRALRSLADSTAPFATEVASAALEDADPRIRGEALATLGTLLAKDFAGRSLAPLLQDPHPHVRIAAIRALGDSAPIAALMDLLAPALESHSSWERSVALRAASTRYMGLGVVPQALHLVARGQEDPAWDVRHTAAEILAEICAEHVDLQSSSSAGLPPELAIRLRRALEDDPRVAKAVVVPWVLSQAHTRASFAQLQPTLGPFAEHADEILRAMTLEGLREALVAGTVFVSPALLDFLARRAGDPASDVRVTLIGIYSQLLETDRREDAVARLFAFAREDENRLVRGAAIDVLQAAAGEEDPWAADAHGLELGSVGGDKSLKDYRRALWYADRAAEAIFETASGRLRIRLYGADAPLTVYNFMQLAERGYFDGGAWHRVVPNFVIQDGCPRRDGWGGPGYALRCEINPHAYVPGALGMALSGKDTGGSQFFLTLSDQPHLDGRYTIFGQLVEGWDVLGAVQQGERIERVRIVQVRK